MIWGYPYFWKHPYGSRISTRPSPIRIILSRLHGVSPHWPRVAHPLLQTPWLLTRQVRAGLSRFFEKMSTWYHLMRSYITWWGHIKSWKQKLHQFFHPQWGWCVGLQPPLKQPRAMVNFCSRTMFCKKTPCDAGVKIACCEATIHLPSHEKNVCFGHPLT